MKEKYKRLIKISVVIVIIYFLVMGLIFFLAHDQLFLQKTRGYCDWQGADYAISEVSDGICIAQDFEPGMDIIKEINVQMITYLRENSGKLFIELYDFDDKRVIALKEYNIADIEDMSFVGISFDEPYYMGNHYLSFRLYSQDSYSGQAVAPMINTSLEDKHGQLFINEEPVQGRMGIYAEGYQTIWAGPHYLNIVMIGFCFIFTIILLMFIELHYSRKLLIFDLMDIFIKYSFLIGQLIGSSFKTKYKRSFLGVFWSFLNPLFSMIVQYVVFSTMFRANTEYYHIYLLIGITFFNFFSTSVTRAIWSIVRNASLIKKVYVPKWIYPFADIQSSFVDFTISLLPLIVLICISGITYKKAVWLVLFSILCLQLFSIGFGLMMSAFMVYFRDIEHIWSVITMIWLYGTPIFYTKDILPEEIQKVLEYNPIYMFIDFARTCIIKGISPYPGDYVRCFLVANMMLMVGVFIFKKMQNGFLLRI